jgi:hypothetical protein
VNGTLRDFFEAKLLTISSKSFFMLSNDRYARRPCFIVVRSLFLKIFVLENERSPLQLETIINKYILSVISTLGNAAPRLLLARIL